MKSFCLLSLVSFLPLAFGSNLLPPDSLKKVRNILQNEKACFLLKEKSAHQPEMRFGKPICEKSFPLGNRDLMPLAIVATERGLIQDEKTLFKWDGTRYSNPRWNKDQFVTDWLQNQTAWVSDRLRLQLGPQAMEKYLNQFELSGEISTEKFTLFSERFFSGNLDFSKTKQDLARRLFYIGKYRYGTEVWGQKATNPDCVAFTGYLVSKGQAWTFSTLMTPSSTSKELLTAERAQALSMDILTELGLF